MTRRPDPRTSSADPALTAPLPAATSADPLLTVIDTDEARFVRGPRSYRVRGLSRCLSAESLKLTLRVAFADPSTGSGPTGFFVDTLDLYQARSRAAFVRGAALELGVAADVIGADLSALVLALEPVQEAVIRGALAPDVDESPVLSAEDEAAGLALLGDPLLVDRIVRDVEAIGVVGEADNALVGYLAMVSRLLDRPLAILIQSTSAAGKSTLMDALLSLLPDSQRVHYSAMTGQSLFYLGEKDLQHKVLAIAEEEGVRQAAYALKLLQSQGELTIASTGKDPTSGKLVTAEYRVEGPVMLCLTTTAIDIDEELLNRCLVLTINETTEQTAAIQQRQRQGRTLAGLQAKVHGDAVLAAHRAAQTLLRPLAVVNPFAEALTFASDRVRLRRDHVKYLALIDAIALLHQHQRPVHRLEADGAVVEYVEVTASDIALTNRLAHAVLGRSLDELPPQTRRVLSQLAAWVTEQATAQGIERTLVRFTRRAARAALGLSDTQLRVHLERLVELDYVELHGGRAGQRFHYRLLFDGDAERDTPQLMGLHEPGAAVSTEPTSRGKSPTSRGAVAKLAGGSRADSGALAGASRGAEKGRNAKSGAGCSDEATPTARNARHRSRVNGAAATP